MATLQTTEEQIAQESLDLSVFNDTVRERAINDADFRLSLVEMAASAIVSGDLDEGKAALRAYIKSTTGYGPLAKQAGMHTKSLIRMLGPDGNPRASNLVAIFAQALALEDIRLEVKAARNTS